MMALTGRGGGRWQARPQEDGSRAYVRTGGGTHQFSLVVDDNFERDIETIAKTLQGDWSKAEVVREVVARAAGRERSQERMTMSWQRGPKRHRLVDTEWGEPKKPVGIPIREKYAPETCERIERLTGKSLHRWNNLVQHWKNDIPEEIVLKYLDSVKEEQ